MTGSTLSISCSGGFRRGGGDHPYLQEKFSILPSKNEQKKSLDYLEWLQKEIFA
jgi:hypothetical protein